MGKTDDIITIREYASGPDAYIACGLLRSEGIEATVSGGLSTLYCPLPPPAGGFLLQVFARDADKALEILGDN